MKELDPVQAGAAYALVYTWLHGFCQRYIGDPDMVWYLFMLHIIGLLLDLVLDGKEGSLSIGRSRKKIGKLLYTFIGSGLVLYLANFARYSPPMFWLPYLAVALLFAPVATSITKNLSKLGWITPTLAHFIEGRINATIQKVKNESEYEQRIRSNENFPQTPVGTQPEPMPEAVFDQSDQAPH